MPNGWKICMKKFDSSQKINFLADDIERSIEEYRERTQN